jgi:hypothetical protein
MFERLTASVLMVLLAMPCVNAQTRPDDADAWRTYAAKLDPNAYVRVRLKDGKNLKGYVVEVAPDAIRVNPRTRVAVPLRTVRFDEIVAIDRRSEPKWNPGAKVLLGVGIGVATLMVVSLIALSAAWD